MTNEEIIEHMAEKNGLGYNLLKSVEELLELAEVLQKRVIKVGTEKDPSDQSIIEEIGDVQIRLDVLKYLFNNDRVQERIDYKLEKFKGYVSENKYKGKI